MRRRTKALAAVAGYAAITVIYAWPLPLTFRSAVPSDPIDPLLNAWILWWSTRVLPLTASWWNAPAFFPAPGVLAFSEHLLGLAPLTAPIIAWTHDVVLAYNAAFLTSYFLSAVAAFTLGFVVTDRLDAAFVAGLAYGFAPYRLAQIAHIQVLAAWWIPVCLIGLHLYDRSGRVRWILLAAGAWLMQGYTNGYFLLFMGPLIGLWVLWYAPGRWSRRQIAWAGASFAATAVLVAPVLAGYQRVLVQTYGFSRTISEIRFFSADMAGLLFASSHSLMWSWLHLTHRGESNIFPGITTAVLAVVAVVRARPLAPAAGDSLTARRVRLALAVAALLAAIAAVIPLAFGPLRWTIGGHRVLSIARADKPATLALAAGLCLIAVLPRVRASWTTRSALTFYAAAAFFMWLLALGPEPTFLDERVLYQAPYAWLMRLPGFDGLRVPARFWMLAVACLSALAALAIARLPARTRKTAVIIASIGILLDSWPRPFPLAFVDQPRPAPAGAATRIDLPVGRRDAMAMYQETLDGVPLHNGYSGYFPPHYFALRTLIASRDSRILQALAATGPLGIVVDHAGDRSKRLRRWILEAGAQPRTAASKWSSYLLPQTGAPAPADVEGTVVRPASVSAYPSASLATNAIDGRMDTRWPGGVQQHAAGYQIELAEPSDVRQVVTYLGPSYTDFARRLRVDVSTDRVNWTTVFLDDTALLAYYGALRHPKTIPIVIPVDHAGVISIRLQQIGFNRQGWSIAEIEVRR